MTHDAKGPEVIQVADFEDAIELFHRNGWTDGLPIIPPTARRVDQFLEAAGLKAQDELGFYEPRKRPILAEKLAINAVMAGCLPEHFPVVVAIIEALLGEPDLLLHAANSSTSSFTLGFIVNGPIRRALNMNWNGNVLGPGNRANSSIGRAIRLIQINVMGSTPGAGSSTLTHDLPVQDRSALGQPAKYAGYHIVENEEDFPSLKPTHVEMGYLPEDSTVTVFSIAGGVWIDAHAETTPEAFIDTMAHYVVNSGRLLDGGMGVLLLPPENARLFAEAGWSKGDIRKALSERTRRSIAWVKEAGFKTALMRERGEAVQPGDEDSFVAFGTPSPHDLLIAVCGGPAGAWPHYLFTYHGYMKTATRRIGRKTPADALAPLGAMLATDGYLLEIDEVAQGVLVATIKAGPEACADCLVPKTMMVGYFDQALQRAMGDTAPSIRLVYPADG